MVNNPDWDQLVRSISDLIHVPERVINLVSVSDILKLSVSGLSNTEISSYYKLDDIDMVKEEILSFIDNFDGWEDTLTVNPLIVYKTMIESGYYEEEQFIFEVTVIAPEYNKEVIKRMFNSVIQFYKLVEEMEKSWK